MMHTDERVSRVHSIAALCAFLMCGFAMANPAADSRTNAEMARLTLCLVDADIAVATVTQMRAGRPREDVERAVEAALEDPTYREYVKRTVSAIYAVKPRDPVVWLGQRLRACAGGASRQARSELAETCYRLSRYAKELFALREAGAPLADALAWGEQRAARDGLTDDSMASLQRLARTIYGSGTGVTQFRTGLFVSCVLPRERR